MGTLVNFPQPDRRSDAEILNDWLESCGDCSPVDFDNLNALRVHLLGERSQSAIIWYRRVQPFWLSAYDRRGQEVVAMNTGAVSPVASVLGGNVTKHSRAVIHRFQVVGSGVRRRMISWAVVENGNRIVIVVRDDGDLPPPSRGK